MNDLLELRYAISYKALPLLFAVVLHAYGRELPIIHTFPSTFASGLSGTILSTAVGWVQGVSP